MPKKKGKIKYIIAIGHRPIYESQPSNRPPNWLYDLMLESGVDIYFSGHVHSYGRGSWSGTFGRGEEGSLPLILVGGAGCDEMAQGMDVEHKVDFQIKQYTNYSIGFLSVSETELVWENFDVVSGKIVDRLVVPQKKKVQSRTPIYL